MTRKVKFIENPTILPDSPKLTPLEASAYTGFKIGTLDNWRSTKKVKIPYIKVGGRVYYDKADLDAFLANCKVEG